MKKTDVVDVELYELQKHIKKGCSEVSGDLADEASRLDFDQILNPPSIVNKALRLIVMESLEKEKEILNKYRGDDLEAGRNGYENY